MKRAIIVPRTSLPDDLADQLTKIFEEVIVYSPVGMGLDSENRAGKVVRIEPEADFIDPADLKPVLSEVRNLVRSIRDPRELAHLHTLVDKGQDEASPSALISAIRGYGRRTEGPDLSPHLILHLAEWRDQRRREEAGAVSKLEAQRAKLAESLGDGVNEEPEIFPRTFDPLSLEEDDPLIGIRVKAWFRIFQKQPMEAEAWITDRATGSYLRSLVEEAGDIPDLGLGSLDLNPEAEALIGSEEPFGDRGDQARVWRVAGKNLGLVVGEPDLPWPERLTVIEVINL